MLCAALGLVAINPRKIPEKLHPGKTGTHLKLVLCRALYRWASAETMSQLTNPLISVALIAPFINSEVSPHLYFRRKPVFRLGLFLYKIFFGCNGESFLKTVFILAFK